jgi:hypothetical protein
MRGTNGRRRGWRRSKEKTEEDGRWKNVLVNLS